MGRNPKRAPRLNEDKFFLITNVDYTVLNIRRTIIVNHLNEKKELWYLYDETYSKWNLINRDRFMKEWADVFVYVKSVILEKTIKYKF